MKAVILAGGLGSRISEETADKPKPMVEIGGRPIIWHLMKTYSAHNIREFIILCGYKGYVIKEYFSNYLLHQSDVTIDLTENNIVVHQKRAEDWKITLLDTGDLTMTGGRLKRARAHLENEKAFCFTYGDGLADVDFTRLIEFHNSHGKLATITAVTPPGRFGSLVLSGVTVAQFVEKPAGDGGMINGGFFVLSPDVIDLIADDDTTWEAEPLSTLAGMGEIMAYQHGGFWRAMDTLRDKNHLNEMWSSGNAPWKVW